MDVILPFHIPTPSAWKDLHLYKLSVHGVINHGLQQRYLYLHQGQFGCGPDFAISILHHHLHHVLTGPHAAQPSTLYLQFNNCSHENKNKFMLAYCNWLIVNGVFHNIHLSFLPVGHTHEDINQMFSTFVVGMHHEPRIASIQQFVISLDKWYNKPCTRPEAIFLREAWSFKSWLSGHIPHIQGTSKPHTFRFFQNSATACVELWSKDYVSSDSQWEGPVSILRDDPPMTEPSLLSPACLDPEVLRDTEHALQNLEGCAALKQALRDVVG